MKIKLNSVFVDDQEKALKFCTELLLEPDENPAARAFKKALFEQGIPLTAFQVYAGANKNGTNNTGRI